MEELIQHQNKIIERLRADHRRVRIVYGIALIIVTLAITGIVLHTPYFQWF